MSTRRLLVVPLGHLAFSEALELQRAVSAARITGAVPDDVLLLVEHPPVVTLGRSTKGSNLQIPDALLAARGVERYEIERGGDATFHGPGQLVGYPIIDLKQHTQDLHWYLRQVEEALIVALAAFGLAAGRMPKYTGVWIDDRKIASIGVHARDWVTRHGFALNVDTDLSYFDLFTPCGIADVVMTSTRAELGAAAPAFDDVTTAVASAFATVFSLIPCPTSEELEAHLAPAASVAPA
ncbi:MAG: lipoyl(octanoyl) transferase LipB [Gemmatimonadaceae bacterium]|nr:lipoyl(octanoyl) transferase LipB [Gemmatimonadaceae bacterium]